MVPQVIIAYYAQSYYAFTAIHLLSELITGIYKFIY